MAGTGEAIEPTGGSAATQGDLWAERARDWAEVMEGWNGWGVPLYRQVLERLRVGTGTKLVTGFNSFFFSADLVGALAEARRVARPGGEVAMTVFGRPDRCESTPMFAALGQLLPGDSGGSDDGPALYQEGVLESLAKQAGLRPRESGHLEVVEEYPDVTTLLRGYLAHGSVIKTVRSAGEPAVRDALTHGVRALVTTDGGVRIEDEYRYLVATS